VSFLSYGLFLLTNLQFGTLLQTLIGAEFTLLLGIGVYFLVEYTLQRRVPLLIALGVLAGLPLLFAVINQRSLEAILNALMAMVVLYSARFWFPSFAPYAKDAVGMHKEGKNRAWGLAFVAVATIINLAIYMFSATTNS